MALRTAAASCPSSCSRRRWSQRRVKPDPLTDPATPWLARDPETAITGLNPDGRVEIDDDVKADNKGADVIRLAWAVALGYASPHIAALGRELVVVSGAEQGSLDISPLDAVRLRNLCASGLTYCHHVEEVKEDRRVRASVEEWDEPAPDDPAVPDHAGRPGHPALPAGTGSHHQGAGAAPGRHPAGGPGRRCGHHRGLLAGSADRPDPGQAQPQ